MADGVRMHRLQQTQLNTLSLRALATIAFGVVVACAGAAAAQYPVPVNVETTPPGAQVFVDSAQTPAIGVTPLRNVRIPRGSHTLLFKLEGHEDGQLPVNIRRRRETFRFVMKALGTVSIISGGDSAANAAVRIDGEPVGNIPFRGTVQPGRHLLQVGKEGFVTFTQWVEVSGAQVLTLPVTLEVDQPDTGSILIAGDISGAAVYLDGEPKGVTPTVLENVPVGAHSIELRPDGMAPWQETVQVLQGQRVNLNPNLRASASTGSVRVISNIPGATIALDGVAVGQAPVSIPDVPTGEHILEATAAGHHPIQQPIEIAPGQQRVVSLRLEANENAAGRILIDSNVGAATISIDGQEYGAPPVVVERPPLGFHTVRVVAEGYEDFRETCETALAKDCQIDAVLSPVGTPVIVETTAPNAELYVDGVFLGTLPYTGKVPTGPHRIEVRAPGYRTESRTLNLAMSNTARSLDVSLAPEGTPTPDEVQRERLLRNISAESVTARSAAILPPEQGVLDMSVGWAFPLEGRISVGILPWLEGGFAIRTMMFRYTEFELRAKAGMRPLEQVSGAVQVRMAGGLGPSRGLSDLEEQVCASAAAPAECADDPSHSVNSFRLSADAMGSLHFSDQGAFTMWMGLDFHTDGYDWSGEDTDVLVTSPLGDAGLDLLDDRVVANRRDGRQTMFRFRLGGSLELVLNRFWNAWVMIEGVIGPSRDLLGSNFGFGPEDTEFYARLGATYKF